MQAGDLVLGGWQYLVNAGGSTVYAGQLAAEFIVVPDVTRPRLTVLRLGGFIDLSWPAEASEFVLEGSSVLSAEAQWRVVAAEPFEEAGSLHVLLPATSGRQWFRLKR